MSQNATLMTGVGLGAGGQRAGAILIMLSKQSLNRRLWPLPSSMFILRPVAEVL